MELNGLSTKLTLEEGITSSSSGDEISTNSLKVITTTFYQFII